MPLFDFVCADCAHQFEQLIRGDDRPVCPACGGGRVEKLMSTFAVRRRSSGARGQATPPAGGSKCSGCSGASCATCR